MPIPAFAFAVWFDGSAHRGNSDATVVLRGIANGHAGPSEANQAIACGGA